METDTEKRKIEIIIGGKTFTATFKKSDCPSYFNPFYGPNQEYRDSMMRRMVISQITKQLLDEN